MGRHARRRGIAPKVRTAGLGRDCGNTVDCGGCAGILHLEEQVMTESSSTTGLGYQPRAAFAQYADPAIADCQGKRIGILVVTYNAITTLVPVLQRIPPSVWSNVEEVVVFDD